MSLTKAAAGHGSSERFAYGWGSPKSSGMLGQAGSAEPSRRFASGWGSWIRARKLRPLLGEQEMGRSCIRTLLVQGLAGDNEFRRHYEGFVVRSGLLVISLESALTLRASSSISGRAARSASVSHQEKTVARVIAPKPPDRGKVAPGKKQRASSANCQPSPETCPAPTEQTS